MTEYELVSASDLRNYIGYSGTVIYVRIMRTSEGRLKNVSLQHVSLEVPGKGTLHKIPTGQVLGGEFKK